MRLGIDVSTYLEEIAHGAKYFDGEKEVQPLQLFRQNGVDLMRIRLWVNPFDENGAPYLAGTCDLQNFLQLATLAQQNGYGILLDFHYSDFWCDPAKQFVPKAWKNLTFEQLVNKVYCYTRDVLTQCAQHNLDIQCIQTGNEITNGILWPFGKLEWDERKGERANYENLVKLLKSAGKACREVYPKAQIVLHLERSYDQAIYNEFFTKMQLFGVDYDVIGMSYYPYWHGTMEQLFANVEACKKFGKQIAIVETGYAFTLEDYVKNEHGAAHLVVNVSDVLPGDFAQKYPLDPQGQSKFVEDLLEGARRHGVSAVVWWEPLWLPGDGICWASEEGQRYIGETGKSTRNEWANQCLFDYDGKKLPAFEKFVKK